LHARAVDTRGGIDADSGNQTGGAVATGMKARLLEKQKKDAGVDSRDIGEVVSLLKDVLAWLSDMVMKLELYKIEKLKQEADKAEELIEADEKKDDYETKQHVRLYSMSMASYKREKSAEEKKVELVLDACEALLPTSGTDYVLRLSNDEQYLRTEECKEAREKNRRNRITKDLYYCHLLINDKSVGTTQAKGLEWPSFQVLFNKRFRCRLLRRPQSIKMQIFRSRGLLQDELISDCMVQVPGSGAEHDGASTHSLSQAVHWYQFSQRPAVTSIFKKSNDADRDVVRIYGGAMVGVEWGLEEIEDGDGGESKVKTMAPPLPDRPLESDDGRLQGLKTAEMDAKKSNDDTDHVGKPAEFARERDFLSMLPKLTTCDPNDPRNTNLFRLSEMLLPSQKSQDVFRTLEREMIAVFKVPGTNTIYPNHYALEQPRRHQLLKLRALKPTLFSGAIPLSEDVIKKDENYRAILAAERRRHAEDEDTEQAAGNQRKAVDKAKIRDFVKRVRDTNQAESRNRQRKRHIHHSEIVQEGLLPDFVKVAFDFNDIVEFIVPPRKRGLCPNVVNRVAVTAMVRKCRLLITVIGARNVPSRVPRITAKAPGSPQKRGKSPTRRKKGADDDDDNDLTDYTVNSFVTVKFQDNEDSTRPVLGPAPLWKQTLDVAFRPPMGDFSPARLQQVRDNVEINLFDAVEVDNGETGGYYDDENTVRTEKRYLGNLSIPFSTIYMEGRVEGTFRLNAPDLCLGYQRRAQSVLEPGSAQAFFDDEKNRDDMDAPGGEGGEEKSKESGNGAGKVLPPGGPSSAQLTVEAEEATYVKILATLEPLLVAPPKDAAPMISKEEKKLVSYAKTWVERTKKSNKFTLKREIEVLVPDMHGSSWMITRYLRPLEPPPGCDTIAKCAHFVAMIPFLEDWQAFMGDYDMWCTCQQFLDILAGDWEEHATLLANYFLFLSERHPDTMGASVYLVLGTGIPEGDTIYVMRQDDTTKEIVYWNASTGMGYGSADERCPLKDVGMLANSENCWANVQNVGSPSEISLDVNDTKAWRPFYGTRYPGPPIPLPSIQETRLNYPEPNHHFAEEMQDELIEVLKRDIRRWRRGPTGFKQDAGSRLRALLESMEHAKNGEQTLSHVEHLNRLEQATRGRDLYGLPQNFAFTDVNEIVSKIKATEVHSCKHPDVEFALAVRVFPYHSNVLSVWVYFAALTPK
jgi:coiled-coil and C2 domain-containing protein 2A